MRYALYFTPPQDNPLSMAASRWIGRDVHGGVAPPLPEEIGLPCAWLAGITENPRRYGFHATLKAPFRLADTMDEATLIAAMESFCANTAPVMLERLAIDRIGQFLALVPAVPQGPIRDLAARIVQAFEPFRAPLTEAEIARRNPESLTASQRANLHAWGYPYVMEAFRFHMTLTGPVTDTEANRVATVLRNWLAPVLVRPLEIDGLSLFIEPEPGAPFLIRHKAAFAAAAMHDAQQKADTDA